MRGECAKPLERQIPHSPGDERVARAVHQRHDPQVPGSPEGHGEQHADREDGQEQSDRVEDAQRRAQTWRLKQSSTVWT